MNEGDACFRASTSTILSVVYDHPWISSKEDPLVEKIHAFNQLFASAAVPGAYLVEFLPWMKHIPSSIAKWKRDMEELHRQYSALFAGMFRDVESRIVRPI